jgi:hypothetical protein
MPSPDQAKPIVEVGYVDNVIRLPVEYVGEPPFTAPNHLAGPDVAFEVVSRVSSEFFANVRRVIDFTHDKIADSIKIRDSTSDVMYEIEDKLHALGLFALGFISGYGDESVDKKRRWFR